MEPLDEPVRTKVRTGVRTRAAAAAAAVEDVAAVDDVAAATAAPVRKRAQRAKKPAKVPMSVYEIPEDMRTIPAKKLSTYIPDLNLLDPAVLAREMAEHIPATRLLTSPSICLEVAYGFIEGVNVHEREIVKGAILNEDILVYNSNYGRVIYPHYAYPVPKPKTNRGRKPKKQTEQRRIKQGDGSDMASQVSIFVRSRTCEPEHGYIVPASAEVYKTKVFCTGDVQVPNAAQVNLKDMLDCIHVLVHTLNQILHGGAPICRLRYIHPTLKNFKMEVNTPKGYIINLSHLRSILSHFMPDNDRRSRPIPASYDAPPHPVIYRVIYDRRDDSSLAVIFGTPMPHNRIKTLRMCVYIDGSITILGGLYIHITEQVFRFINWILEENYYEIFARICTFPIVPNIATSHPRVLINLNESIRRELAYAVALSKGYTGNAARVYADLFWDTM